MEHKVVKKTEVKVEEAKSKKDRELQEPKMSSEAELRNIVKPLVNWYRENKRDLPWRHNPDAYRVWISEIMLQQTRVEAVKGYYDRFLKALPTVKDLAEAEEDKLLKLWEGLGYYNRVRNMQKAAHCHTECQIDLFYRSTTYLFNLYSLFICHKRYMKFFICHKLFIFSTCDLTDE